MFVIFDMDGTLVDSSQTLINAINYVRSKLSLPVMDGKKIMDGIVNPHSNMPREFYGIDKIEPIHEEWFKEYYSANHNRELKLFDGVEEMLSKLQENGIKTALATNAYRDSTMQALSHLKIDKYFNDIVCFDEVENGKPAITHYRIIERYRNYTHISVKLETGRTHQIRVHMAYKRYPLLGDPVYGGRRIHKFKNFNRQALHAASLGLDHPNSGEFMQWTAALPDDMLKLLEELKQDKQEHA